MNKTMWAGIGIAVLASAAAAQSQWSNEGWAPGNAGGYGLGRTDGPVTAEITQIEGGVSVGVTVSGCGGVRDYRSFGRDVVGGEGQGRDVAAALNHLLGEARRVCGFEQRLAGRIAQGLEPAFAAWLEESANMSMDMNAMDMGMDSNMAIDCPEGECNAI